MNEDRIKQFEEMLKDFGNNVYFEGNPRRTKGTTEQSLIDWFKSEVKAGKLEVIRELENCIIEHSAVYMYNLDELTQKIEGE